MDNEIMTILGFVGALIAIAAPILKLNSNLVRLNSNFEHMMKSDEIRDKRIEKHGAEIDEVKIVANENSHVLSNHETRIQSLERRGSA